MWIQEFVWEEVVIMLDNFDVDKKYFVPADKSKHTKQNKKEEKTQKSFAKTMQRSIKKPSTIVGLSLLFNILLLAFLPPLFSKKTTSFSDSLYAYKLPKVDGFSGSGFWDGSYKASVNEKRYYSLMSIGAGELDKDGLSFDQKDYQKSTLNPIQKTLNEYEKEGTKYRNVRIDSYFEVGFVYNIVDLEKFNLITEYENKSGLKVLYPMVDSSKEHFEGEEEANIFYHTKDLYPCNELGEYIDYDSGLVIDNPKGQNLRIYPNYLLDSESKPTYYEKLGNSYQIRVLYYNYYQFNYWMKKGGNNYYCSPSYIFGSDAQGYDILLRTSSGIRLSLLLSLIVFVINFIIGSVFGIIEGYYGGKIDLALFYFSEILKSVPFVIVASLFAKHFIVKGMMTAFVGLLVAFILTGWISIANQTRRQIYRFKNRGFVFASRQLGASDFHIIKKHIYPHAISSLITSLVLYIPGIIFSETTLSFLGIIEFNGASFTSLGTMIANGQNYIATFPHIIVLPALVISVLMIAFNLIGNGLREAIDNDSFRKKKK